MSIEAMKQALEAFDAPILADELEDRMQRRKACDALRQAIDRAEKRHWEYLPEDDIKELVSFLMSRLKEKKPITQERVAEALYGAVYLASLHSRKLNENNVI